jgi:hypothetical protein
MQIQKFKILEKNNFSDILYGMKLTFNFSKINKFLGGNIEKTSFGEKR